jgi:uncharacterized UPF0160 family protein
LGVFQAWYRFRQTDAFMTTTHLVTHSGGFHADELLSSVILTRLFPQAALVRSRVTEWIVPKDGRIIYDVGHAYDPDARIFDHHQRPGPRRDDGRPFSSFGLIWRHYGRDYLRSMAVPPQHIDETHAILDEAFVVPVDLLDNGAIEPSEAGPLAALTLPVLLETLKPVFDARSPAAEDRAFAAALPVAGAFLGAAVRNRSATCRAEATVLEAIAAAGASPILELPMGMPYLSAIEKSGADHLRFVVHPREGDWALTTIPTGRDTFETRADLPASWAGLADADLEAACGVRGARFCHSARFIAVADSRAAILSMADRALSETTSR